LFFLFSSDRVWLVLFFFLHHSVKKKSNHKENWLFVSLPVPDFIRLRRLQTKTKIAAKSVSCPEERRYFLTA
jgi:hypothetical protein